jgi:hypothetical protein
LHPSKVDQCTLNADGRARPRARDVAASACEQPGCAPGESGRDAESGGSRLDGDQTLAPPGILYRYHSTAFMSAGVHNDIIPQYLQPCGMATMVKTG